MKMNKVPHKCNYCNKQLYIETLVYRNGIYYCKKHWTKKYIENVNIKQ